MGAVRRGRVKGSVSLHLKQRHKHFAIQGLYRILQSYYGRLNVELKSIQRENHVHILELWLCGGVNILTRGLTSMDIIFIRIEIIQYKVGIVF